MEGKEGRKQVTTSANWNLIPLGTPGKYSRTHTSAISLWKGERTGVFIHQLSFVISQELLLGGVRFLHFCPTLHTGTDGAGGQRYPGDGI